jgi:hypothetical protein
MVKTRSIALSLTVAAFGVLGAGCQSGAEEARPAAAAADNTAEICDAFRHFEVDHLDKPAAAGDNLDSNLQSFDTVAAADMKKLAGRATDSTVAAQLSAISTQISLLAGGSGKTYDQVALANPDAFTAGGKAWVALEGRCGKAIVPTP